MFFGITSAIKPEQATILGSQTQDGKSLTVSFIV
jgi:hypothetical protein